MARKKTIEVGFRCKFICEGAKTLDEMIQALEGAVAQLREMKADGVELEDEVADDYPQLSLTTSDPKLIKKYQAEEA
jgi:TATA-box binding protein (TBP) (component of TFIID and TFIIIB)